MTRAVMRRAASMVAEFKIKRNLDEFNKWEDEEESNEEKASKKLGSTNEPAKKKHKKNDEDTKNDVEFKAKSSHRDTNANGESKRPSSHSTSSTASSKSLMVSSNSESESASSDDEENLTEAEILHQEHMRRRAARQVHSNRPMYFSRRLSWRMLCEQESPEFSPLQACTLGFSPSQARILKIKRSRRA